MRFNSHPFHSVCRALELAPAKAKRSALTRGSNARTTRTRYTPPLSNGKHFLAQHVIQQNSLLKNSGTLLDKPSYQVVVAAFGRLIISADG